MLNRLVKIAGVLAWTTYANRVQGHSCHVQPRTVMATVLLCTCGVSLALAHAPKSAGSLRVLLMLFGFAYGIFDQGSMQLALWYSETSANKRTAMAAVSTGYGLGAILTPLLVAVALKVGGSAYTAFDGLAVLAALVSLLHVFLTPPVSPVRYSPVLEGGPVGAAEAGDVPLLAGPPFDGLGHHAVDALDLAPGSDDESARCAAPPPISERRVTCSRSRENLHAGTARAFEPAARTRWLWARAARPRTLRRAARLPAPRPRPPSSPQTPCPRSPRTGATSGCGRRSYIGPSRWCPRRWQASTARRRRGRGGPTGAEAASAPTTPS